MTHKSPLQVITESLQESPEITVALLHGVILNLYEEDSVEDDTEVEIEVDEEAVDDDIVLDEDDVVEEVTEEDTAIDLSDAPEFTPVKEAIAEFFSTFDSISAETMAGKRLVVLLKCVPSGATAMAHWLEKYYRLALSANMPAQ